MDLSRLPPPFEWVPVPRTEKVVAVAAVGRGEGPAEQNKPANKTLGAGVGAGGCAAGLDEGRSLIGAFGKKSPAGAHLKGLSEPSFPFPRVAVRVFPRAHARRPFPAAGRLGFTDEGLWSLPASRGCPVWRCARGSTLVGIRGFSFLGLESCCDRSAPDLCCDGGKAARSAA